MIHFKKQPFLTKFLQIIISLLYNYFCSATLENKMTPNMITITNTKETFI